MFLSDWVVSRKNVTARFGRSYYRNWDMYKHIYKMALLDSGLHSNTASS